MNLRQLEYFATIARLQSVTKASATLRIAQPALTRHIKNLETDLRVELFEKNGRGITLTVAGQEYYERVMKILEDLSDADEALDKYRAGSKRELRFGMPSSLGAQLAEQMINAAKSAKPSIDLQVIDGWSRFIADWLLSEQLDIGIVYDHTIDDPLIETAYVASEAQYFVGHRDAFPVHCAGMSLKEIAGKPMILPSRQHGLRKSVDKAMAAIGEIVNPVMELDAAPTIKTMIERGNAFSILAESDISLGLSHNLVAVPIQEPRLVRDLFVAWRRDSRRLRLVKQMLAIIEDETASVLKQGTWGERRQSA